MKIGVASGKGGTGKTTIATSLALSLEGPLQFFDCDVEEPNGHIFLRPEIVERESVGIPVPLVDLAKCTFCGRCGEICQFSSIVPLKDTVLVFPQLCHGCGGCTRVCPTGAISEKKVEIGILERGHSGQIEFRHGRLNISEPKSPPLIRALKNYLDEDKDAIIDAPPGTSCPVIESIKGCDVTLLVTEPTPFGLHDLTLAVEMTRKLTLPIGVIINRCDIGDSSVVDYCRRENIPVLMEIRNDRKVAEAYSEGIPLVQARPEYRDRFARLRSELQERFPS
jgi:MinD superfamily P-loop ATPase